MFPSGWALHHLDGSKSTFKIDSTRSRQMEWVDLWQLLQLKSLVVGYGLSSAGLYLADPTTPIPSHCAVIIQFINIPVHQLSWLAL